MAFQPVPNTAQATVIYTINGVRVVNTFYFNKPGGYVEADIADLAGQIDLWVDGNLKAELSSQVAYLGTEVRGLASEEDFLAVATANAGNGAELTNPMPNNVAIAMKRTSGLTGRSARGRIYFPVHAGAISSNENQLTTDFLNAVRAALNALRVAVAVLEWVEVIVSRYNDGAKRTEGVVFEVVGYNYTDVQVDTMRGRLA